jgi:hypothetical protein
MNVKKLKRIRGVSLVEVMLAITITFIGFLGTTSYRYQASFDAKKADIQNSSSQIALLLVEDWRGIKGSDTFNPVSHFSSALTIEKTNSGPAKDADFTLLGNYKITADLVDYYITLSWKDMQPSLKALSVIIAYSQRGEEILDADEGDKIFELTSYAYDYSNHI